MSATKSAQDTDPAERAPFWWRSAEAQRLARQFQPRESEVENLDPKDLVEDLEDMRPQSPKRA